MTSKKEPTSLENICIRWICRNLNQLTYLDHGPPKRMQYRDPNTFIVTGAAEKLLLKLCKRGLLNDESIHLFGPQYVNLVSPIIKDSSVNSSHLKILNGFCLHNLSAINLSNVTLNNLISCLGESTIKNLSYLNISATSIRCENKLPIIVSLCRFKNLRVLNVGKTEFTTQCLQIIIKDLPSLTHLDISRSKVTDISSLVYLRRQLTGLIMHRVEFACMESTLHTILALSRLKQLELSGDHLSNGGTTQRSCKSVLPLSQLCKATSLPDLSYLDLSGNVLEMTVNMISELLANHKMLNFVGLSCWSNKDLLPLSLSYPDITMTGDCGSRMLLNSLEHYKDRWQYLHNAINNIFEFTKYLSDPQPELLAAVIQTVRLHKRRECLVLAGTAAIYNLTRQSHGLGLPIELLNKAIRITMHVMELFPKNRHLQKNSFLTICNDSMLKRASFSYKKCCELVFAALIEINDNHIKQMGVAIISILAADMSTEDLQDLTSDRRYIRCLLKCVAQKCLPCEELKHAKGFLYDLSSHATEGQEQPVCDATLRFTLSALWNLTDECPQSCQVFIEEQGLFVYHRIFLRFKDQDENTRTHVYTKCLGLLNNVAEVAVTRCSLLCQDLMSLFQEMLLYSAIQVSYFAAGITAHLACESDDTWKKYLTDTKESYMHTLGVAVSKWESPNTSMVAYRSFKPFQTLIQSVDLSEEIYHWVLWAIHHVLSRNNNRYAPLLLQCEYLLNFLQVISQESKFRSNMRQLATDILQLSGENVGQAPV